MIYIERTKNLKMKYINLFEQFLNELNLSDHWVNQRGSKDSKFTRISPRSSTAKDGWICEKMIRR